MNALEWMEEGGEKWEKIKNTITPEEVRVAQAQATESMCRLNRIGKSRNLYWVSASNAG